MLKKALIKNYLTNDKVTKDDLVRLKRYVDLRVQYRDREKELKMELKRKISPILSDNYKHLIGVVERELYEAFYSMTQVNVKYKKRVPKNNYIDYLSTIELRGLNMLKECMITELDRYDNLSLNSASNLAMRVGRQVRKWFYDKYKVLPENIPADEVSYAVCKSTNVKLDNIITLRECPSELTYQKENGQVAMNFDAMTIKKENIDGRR